MRVTLQYRGFRRISLAINLIELHHTCTCKLKTFMSISSNTTVFLSDPNMAISFVISTAVMVHT